VFRDINGLRLFVVVRQPGYTESSLLDGTFRSCGTVRENRCEYVNGMSIPELSLTHGTGHLCYCTTDMCNGGTEPRHAFSIITTVSLFAWITARFLSE